jgi:Yip1 domain
MIKALLLIFDPVATWDRIAEAKRSLVTILLIYTLPLLVLATLGEGYGLTHWGKQRGEYGKPVPVPQQAAVRYGVIKIGVSLAVVFAAALVIRTIGRSFHGRHTYTQAFTCVAYGMGPLFMSYLLNGLPHMPGWAAWGIGAALTVSVLYQGLPRVMMPDLPHTLGLYFLSVMTIVILSCLAQFLFGLILEEQIRAVLTLPSIVPSI